MLVVNISDDDAIVFKIESHNHPSMLTLSCSYWSVELRDVFTMGARPIALLNSIHFGAPEHFKTKSY